MMILFKIERMWTLLFINKNDCFYFKDGHWQSPRPSETKPIYMLFLFRYYKRLAPQRKKTEKSPSMMKCHLFFSKQEFCCCCYYFCDANFYCYFYINFDHRISPPHWNIDDKWEGWVTLPSRTTIRTKEQCCGLGCLSRIRLFPSHIGYRGQKGTANECHIIVSYMPGRLWPCLLM